MYYVINVMYEGNENNKITKIDNQENVINHIYESINNVVEDIKMHHGAYRIGHIKINCPIVDMRGGIVQGRKLEEFYKIKEDIKNSVINIEHESFDDCVIFATIFVKLPESGIDIKHSLAFYVFTEAQYTESLL